MVQIELTGHKKPRSVKFLRRNTTGQKPSKLIILMTSEQNYEGGANYATPIELTAKNGRFADSGEPLTYKNGVVIHNIIDKHPPLSIPSQIFIDSAANVKYVTDMRTAVRSWFCTWIPEDVRQSAHGPSAERGANMFQDLDEFLASLIEAGHRQTVESLMAKISELSQVPKEASRRVK